MVAASMLLSVKTSHLERYFYAHHWKDTPEPKRTLQWLYAR